MKFLKYLVALVIGVTMSVSLVSCGDDDDDEPQGGSSSSYETMLVGEWYCAEEGEGMCFLADKNGYWYEEMESGERRTYAITWSVSSSTLAVTFGPGDVDYFEIVSITESVLLVNRWGTDTQVFTKIK